MAEQQHRAEHVAAADHRDRAAEFVARAVGEGRAAGLAAFAQGLHQRGAVLAMRRVGVGRRAGVAWRARPADHLAGLVQHEHAAVEDARDRLAQRPQRCALGQQRSELLVRFGGILHVARAALQFGAGLVRMLQRRPGFGEGLGIVDGEGRVGRQRAQDRHVERGVRAVVAVGDEEQADHFVVAQQRGADQGRHALVPEGVVQLRVVGEAVVVQVVGREEGQAGGHHDARDAEVAPGRHLAGALGDGAVGHHHLERAAGGVVHRQPAEVGTHELAGAAHDGPQQAGEVEAAGEVLRGFDHREHAALALLVQLHAIAQRHGHAHQLHQRRLALQRIGQCLHVREAAGEVFRRRVPVQQPDEVGGDLFGDLLGGLARRLARGCFSFFLREASFEAQFEGRGGHEARKASRRPRACPLASSLKPRASGTPMRRAHRGALANVLASHSFRNAPCGHFPLPSRFAAAAGKPGYRRPGRRTRKTTKNP